MSFLRVYPTFFPFVSAVVREIVADCERLIVWPVNVSTTVVVVSAVEVFVAEFAVVVIL